MDKNIYKLFGTSNRLNINYVVDNNPCFLCFKLYRHKIKPDIWLIKDISIGPFMRSLSYGDLHQKTIGELYKHIVSFLIGNNTIRLIIFEVFAGSLWYVFEYSMEQAQQISTYPKIVNHNLLTFSNNDSICSFDIINIKQTEKYIILDKFEKDGLMYLKLLTEDKIIEKPWINRDHEFFHLFEFYQIIDDEEFFYDSNEIKFYEGHVVYFILNATFENE